MQFILDLKKSRYSCTIQIKFNVPGDYENASAESNTEINKIFKNHDYNVTSQSYVKGSTGIVIGVVNYAANGVSDEEIADQFLKDKPTTINGVNGSRYTADGGYIFSYQKDGRLIVISTNNEQTVSQFVIV